MRKFSNADRIHLRAASGWLGLGDHLAAHAELDEITPELLTHANVIEVRWQICARLRDWAACLQIGEVLLKIAPRRPSSWRYHAMALHKLKRTQDARNELAQAAQKFPKDWRIRYDLACYACMLGSLPEGRVWLNQAFSLASPAARIRLRALDDPDLSLIWGTA